MQLTFEYTRDLGLGSSPQAVHMMDNTLRVIFLDSDGKVQGLEVYPPFGLYDTLEFSQTGRLSADTSVTHPSIKKIAHYGAYGFWCTGDMHRFVMYMLPFDVSKTLIDGNISYAKDSFVSQLSLSMQNIGGQLVGSHRSVVSPGSRLDLVVFFGNQYIELGRFYIDRVAAGYPDMKVTVSARNALGKLLKDQTFDQDNIFEEATLMENFIAVLELAQVGEFFVADPQKNWKLQFKQDMSILEGLTQVVQLLPQWQVKENTDGVVGIGPITDGRFEQPGTYVFESDKTCWSYDVEYDDEQTYSKLCITCADPPNCLFRQLPPHRWWVPPANKTLYINLPDGTDVAGMNAFADELEQAIAVAGRMESFAGKFTPHMVIGDAVELIETDGTHSFIGTVTSVKHQFGRSGFFTGFTVDSAGRRGKPFLKDLVSEVAGSKRDTSVLIY